MTRHGVFDVVLKGTCGRGLEVTRSLVVHGPGAGLLVDFGLVLAPRPNRL